MFLNNSFLLLEYSFLPCHSCQLWKIILQIVNENKPFCYFQHLHKTEKSVVGHESDKLIESLSAQPTKVRVSMREIADLINHALVEPLEEYRLSNEIPKLPLKDQSPKHLVVAEYDVYKKLFHLNAAKAGGPDGISNWILREYAEFLAKLSQSF